MFYILHLKSFQIFYWIHFHGGLPNLPNFGSDASAWMKLNTDIAILHLE